MAREYYIKEIIDTNHQVFTYLIVQLPKFLEMKEARNSDNYLSEKVKGASNEEFKVTKSLLGMIEKIKNEAHDDDLEQLIHFTLHAFNSANESLKIIEDILSKKKSLDNRLASVNEEKNNLERERNE